MLSDIVDVKMRSYKYLENSLNIDQLQSEKNWVFPFCSKEQVSETHFSKNLPIFEFTFLL
jgi:hypothetical protein